MTALLAAAALLSGIPLGFIIGLIAGVKMAAQRRPEPETQPENWGI